MSASPRRLFGPIRRWLITQGSNLYRYHREACVASLEGGGDINSRLYYFGFGFVLSLLFVLITLVALLVCIKQLPWFDDPWLGTVMFTNFFPMSTRFPELVNRFYYLIEVLLGYSFELFRAERVPAYMNIFTEKGGKYFQDSSSIDKFQQYLQLYRKINSYGSNMFVLMIPISITLAGYMENLHRINLVFYIVWILIVLVQVISSFYIIVSMPCNLVTSVYYLNLKQKCLQVNIGKTAKIQRVAKAFRSYEQCLVDYVDTNRLLGDYNRYWGLYLWMTTTIGPAIICQAIYFLGAGNLQGKIIFLTTAIGYFNQLAFIVYHSSKVGQHNRLNAKLLANVYRRKLERNLVGDLRRHLHLANSMEHVRLSKYSMTTIHGHHICHTTYLKILFKFVYIFFKLIKNNNFRLR